MSMETWINYGIGLCTSDLKIKSEDAIKELISLVPELKEEVEKYLADNGIEHPSVEDYLEFDEDFLNGISYYLERAISKIEDLNVFACDDYEGNRYLIYAPAYPWEQTESDRQLTREKVEEILSKYVSIITDDEFTIDDIKAENFG